GVIRKQVLLTDIRAVAVTETKLIEGWGIHLTARGWLYNVSGWQAVAISLRSGRRLMLGTDEPERLVSALRQQLTLLDVKLEGA
ncbi:MAG: hypothetical protein HC802_19360, partial [Caldilineaceae bacterium]|nr:hypothetical protein [Caldilineaceae bacterium]